MSDWSIQKKGFDELSATLSKNADPRKLKAAMKEALDVTRQEASRFPPQPSRVRAPSGRVNTWIREKGQYTLATFRERSGRFRMRPSTRAGRLIRPSEKLMAHWKTAKADISSGAGYIIGKIVNPVSYGEYVQGEKQASFHKQTGWKTTQQIVKAQQARIMKVFEDAIAELFK